MANENGISEETQVTGQNVDLADMNLDLPEGDNSNMGFLLDIPLEITVRLGKTKVTIGELLKLNQGSVVELNKLTDEPLEIYVNNKLMAEGEVVVVNEKFGIRLTNIISPRDRVQELM